MFCKRRQKEVLVQDCEDCLTWRKCDPVCVKREFVWGVPDGQEPRWVYSYEEAEKLDIDVSYFFDPKWEGNTHLLERVSISTSSYKKAQIPAEIRWAVWERDNFTCKFCGSRKHLTIDHVLPESKGGNLSLANLQTLCKRCNSKKGNRIR